MAYELHDTLSPLSRSERIKVNENWGRIVNALNNLQSQISVIAGGDISDIINELNEAIERLDTMLNEGETLIEDLDGAILTVTGYINTLEDYVPRMEQGVGEMDNLLPVLTNLRDELTTLNNNVTVAEGGRVTAEGTRVTNENTRISNEDTRQANELIRQAALEEMELLVDNFESYEYNNNVEYDFPNFVLYNGSTYLALQRVIGLTPTNDGTNWRLAAQRGVDGTGSVSSVNGIMPDANGNVVVPTGGDIVNNLNSTRTDASLSANMGRQLNNDKVNVSDKATTAEMQAGTNDTKWATPRGVTNALLSHTASTTEVNTGTNDTKFITPLKLNELTGKKADLQTTNKDNLVSGINEVNTNLNQHIAQMTNHIRYSNDTGSANAKVITFSDNAPTSYIEGMAVSFKNNVQNTGATTVNINGLGAKNIFKSNGSNLTSGSLIANSVYTIRYNGTAFFLQGEGGEYGTATPSQVLSGYTIGTDSGILNGSMINRGTVGSTIAINGTYTIPQGYHDGNGKVTQSVSTKSAQTYTPRATNQTISANQYLTGAQTILGDSDLVAPNIKSGVDIFGVVGTFVGKAEASATSVVESNQLGNITISINNLSFRPKGVAVYYSTDFNGNGTYVHINTLSELGVNVSLGKRSSSSSSIAFESAFLDTNGFVVTFLGATASRLEHTVKWYAFA